MQTHEYVNGCAIPLADCGPGIRDAIAEHNDTIEDIWTLLGALGRHLREVCSDFQLGQMPDDTNVMRLKACAIRLNRAAAHRGL